MKRKYIILSIFVASCFLPALSDACPLCQAGATKRTNKAYTEVTAFLALLPIIGGGGIFYWLHAKSKKSDTEVEKNNK
jgi:hypothetical protein